MSNVVRFDCYEADLASGQLRKRGVKLNLREQSFQVLASLLEHPGQVVTREELRRRLWSDEVFVDFENNLNTAVARLREALGDTADRPRFIETLPKRGYRFLAKIVEVPRAEPRVAQRARLVLLPLINLSGEASQDYFSDAMTDEIITELATVAPEHLAVIARTTAMHYKGSHKDVARIGRELNVDYVVEGGVRRSDDRVALNIQLIQTRDQTHLFARKYAGDMRDIFSMQSSAAHDIAAHLPALARHTGTPSQPAKKQPTQDLVAYNLFLQGRHAMQMGGPEAFAKARKCFEEAVARDPQFALAYDALGELCFWAGFYGVAPPRETFSAGLWAALRAIEIDNTLAETHALIGQFRKELEYNWPEVHREMLRALELNPNSPVVRFRHAGSWLMAQGRLQESMAELEALLEADPLSLEVRIWLGVMLWLDRQYGRAVEQVKLALELDPNYQAGHLVLGQTHCMQRNFEDAIVALQKAAELSGGAPMVLGWLGLALAQGGRAEEARSLLQRLHAMTGQTYVSASSFAWIHLGLGEIDDAFTWMDRAIEERDPMMIPIKSYPFLDPLRADPRFHALLRKMNLEAPARRATTA